MKRTIANVSSSKASCSGLRRITSNVARTQQNHQSNGAFASSQIRKSSSSSKNKSAKPVKNYEQYLNTTSLARQPSPIRSLQPLIKIPGMISLGGGMPNTSTFPFENISVTLKGGKTLSIPLESSLQYSPTPGIPELVSQLEQMQEKEHQPPPLPSNKPRKIIVTTGSQDALSKAFDMLVSANTSLLVEKPTYSGSLSALYPIGCNLVSVETDGHGMIPASLEKILKEWDEYKQGPRPKVLYTIPTGGNPTGCSLTLKRKEEIYRIASDPSNNLLILEDDPYYYLRFDPNSPDSKSFLSMDVDGRVLRFDSFSKILSSGLRIGFATGPPELISRLELHQQAAQLHASGLSQSVVAELLRTWNEDGHGNGWEEHLSQVRAFYKRKRDVFLKSAEKHLKGLAEWSVPDAGMFVWIKLLTTDDAEQLVKEKAVEAKVLLVPGTVFIPGGGKSPYVRASFSSASDEDIDKALSRLQLLLTA